MGLCPSVSSPLLSAARGGHLLTTSITSSSPQTLQRFPSSCRVKVNVLSSQGPLPPGPFPAAPTSSPHPMW